jgi:hypothetical protein
MRVAVAARVVEVLAIFILRPQTQQAAASADDGTTTPSTQRQYLVLLSVCV